MTRSILLLIAAAGFLGLYMTFIAEDSPTWLWLCAPMIVFLVG